MIDTIHLLFDHFKLNSASTLNSTEVEDPKATVSPLDGDHTSNNWIDSDTTEKKTTLDRELTTNVIKHNG